MLAYSLFLGAVAFVVFPLFKDFAVLTVFAFLLGLSLGCGQPLSMTLAYNAAPPGRVAESIAMRLAVSYGAHVFIPTAFGALGSLIGLAPVFWLCAAALTGGAAMNARKKRNPR